MKARQVIEAIAGAFAYDFLFPIILLIFTLVMAFFLRPMFSVRSIPTGFTSAQWLDTILLAATLLVVCAIGFALSTQLAVSSWRARHPRRQ